MRTSDVIGSVLIGAVCFGSGIESAFGDSSNTSVIQTMAMLTDRPGERAAGFGNQEKSANVPRKPGAVIPKELRSTIAPKRPRTLPASATRTPYASQPKSLTKSPVSCTAACLAECPGPGGKAGKSACGPVYNACIAAC